jgi:hypothetical protein
MTTAYANYMARYETKHFCGFYLKLSTDFKTNYIYDFIWFSYSTLFCHLRLSYIVVVHIWCFNYQLSFKLPPVATKWDCHGHVSWLANAYKVTIALRNSTCIISIKQMFCTGTKRSSWNFVGPGVLIICIQGKQERISFYTLNVILKSKRYFSEAWS